MKVRIISVAPVKEPFLLAGEEVYRARIKHYVPLEVTALKFKLPASLSASEAAKREGEALIGSLRKGERLILLDEEGRGFSSCEFAQEVGSWMKEGINVALAIGAARGFSDDIKKQAWRCISLSRLTFPYQIARLLLIEQLYRALTILRGEPYHKD